MNVYLILSLICVVENLNILPTKRLPSLESQLEQIGKRGRLIELSDDDIIKYLIAYSKPGTFPKELSLESNVSSPTEKI